MKILRNVLVVIGITLFTLMPLSPLVQVAKADTLLCTIFPFINSIRFFNISAICDPAGGVSSRQDVAEDILGLIRFGTSLIFVGIVIIAVFIVIKAAIKYIQSEGDDKKIEEAQKAIKSVFVGLIALFIGIIGLVLIIVLFNATGAITNITPQQIIENEDPSTLVPTT